MEAFVLFTDDLLTACDYLRMALAQMMARRIPPTPHQYALWYAHASGRDPALSAALLNDASVADLRDPARAANLFHAHCDAPGVSASAHAATSPAALEHAYDLLWELAQRTIADGVPEELMESLRVLEGAIDQFHCSAARDRRGEREMLERVLAQALARAPAAPGAGCLLLLHGCPEAGPLQRLAECFVDEVAVDVYLDHHGQNGLACVIGADLAVARPLAARFGVEAARQGGCQVLLEAAANETPSGLRARAEAALILTRLRCQSHAEYPARTGAGADGPEALRPDRSGRTAC